MQTNPHKHRGFSLLEVVIAVGVFAGSITVILALLPLLTRQAAVTEDTLTALRLTDAVRLELQRMAGGAGLEALSVETAVLAYPRPVTVLLVGSRDGTRVHALSFQPPPVDEQLAGADQYFLIEAWRFPAGPLAFAPGGNVLACHIQVSWPYRLPTSTGPTPVAEREQVTFNLALSR